MVNNAPLVHVSGYARGMTQATVCATESDEFVVTDEMRARHAAWVDEYAAAIFEMWRAEGEVDEDPDKARHAVALVRSEMNVSSRAEWMHPLDAIAIKVTGEPAEVPTGGRRVDTFDSMRTMAGMTRHQRLYWTSRALGIGMAEARKYDPDKGTYDLRGPSCLYRFFDAQGVLLYVGIAKDPVARERQHAQHSTWHAHARSRTIEWFEDRESALAAERAVIRDEAPVFNVVGARGLPAPYTPLLF